MDELALDLDRLGHRGTVTDALDREKAIAVDAHAVGGFMGLGPAAHETDCDAGRSALAVLEVVDIAQRERAVLTGVVEVPEIGLAVEEEDRRHALGSEERKRAEVGIRRYEDPENNRQRDPAERPAQPAACKADTIALRVVQTHRAESRCMNWAIGDASVRSSTKRIADFGISIRDAGSWSSRPRWRIRVSAGALGSELFTCWR